jgi:hypothetical protein
MSRFYEAGPLTEIAINLFHGYGYNFYRIENQLRADDQRVRALASAALSQARAAIDRAESEWRREHIPTPTRANPVPDAAGVAGAQVLERLSRAVGAVEGQVRSQPVPENDRMSQRYRKESTTLEALADKDSLLVGQAELLRSMVAGVDGARVLELAPEIEQGISAIGETLRARQALLL